MVELAILLEEMGSVLLPGPYFSTVVMAGVAISEAASEDQKREFLPRIASGQLIATLAYTEPSGRWDPAGVETTASRVGDEYVINGTKLYVPNGHVSDYIVVVARTGIDETDLSLFLVPSNAGGMSQTLLQTISSDRQSEVVLDSVAVPEFGPARRHRRWMGHDGQGAEVGAVAKCAEMLGGAQRVLDMTLDYVRHRIQFGREIGSFQAIQHHAADMATDVEGVPAHHVQGRLVGFGGAGGRPGSRHGKGMGLRRVAARVRSWPSVSWGDRVHEEHDLQLYSRRGQGQRAHVLGMPACTWKRWPQRWVCKGLVR